MERAIEPRQDRKLVVLCRDASPSMGGRKAERAYEAGRDLLHLLTQGDFDFAVLDFSDTVELAHPPSLAGSLWPRLRPIETGGRGTDLGGPLACATSLVLSRSPGYHPLSAVILFTDGNHNTGPDPCPIADRLKEHAEVFTLGIGPDADANLLEKLASSTDRFHRCGDVPELASRLREIGIQLAAAPARTASNRPRVA